MGEAFSLMKDLKDTEAQYISDLRAKLLDGLKAKFPDIKINGTMDSRHPGNLNVMLSNRDARDMILSLQPKIAFSTRFEGNWSDNRGSRTLFPNYRWSLF